MSQAGIVKAPINKQALLSVDRRNYVRDEEFAYDDSPQYLGYGQTISAPHMHAAVLEDLLPPLLKASRDRPTEPLRILDVVSYNSNPVGHFVFSLGRCCLLTLAHLADPIPQPRGADRGT